jgi:periplasmic divalent cation tolerance protein
MSDALLVMTTLPDQVCAEELAERLLSQKLAACINILPAMSSLYIWKETLEHGKEHLLLIKTCRERYNALESEIRRQHPYELPEIIGIPVIAGLADYLAWIAENSGTGGNHS